MKQQKQLSFSDSIVLLGNFISAIKVKTVFQDLFIETSYYTELMLFKQICIARCISG